MRIAMFGGSFNPIHSGHIQLAGTFVEKMKLDKVLIIPTYIPPHKQADISVSPEDRLEMCRLACMDLPFAEVSDIEISRKGASYTYLTLQELAEKYPDDELFLITGADMFMTIHQWKCPEIIFKLAVICGVPRNDDDISVLEKQSQYLKSIGARTEISEACIMTVSSTLIRSSIKAGKSISGLVPKTVEDYIAKKNLYL